MTRRQLLAALSCLPFCGWMRPKEQSPAIALSNSDARTIESSGDGEWLVYVEFTGTYARATRPHFVMEQANDPH